MNETQRLHNQLIQDIFDYLFSTANAVEKSRPRFYTGDLRCSPLVQVISADVFQDMEDLHPHTTWVTDITVQHVYSRARFINAYNLLTGEPTNESDK